MILNMEKEKPVYINPIQKAKAQRNATKRSIINGTPYTEPDESKLAEKEERMSRRKKLGIQLPTDGHFDVHGTMLKFMPKHFSEIEALAAVLTVRQVAAYFGLGLSAFEKMLDSQPGSRICYERGKAMAIHSIGKTLVQVAESGDVAAIKYYLNCQAGWAEKAIVQHEGKVEVAHELTNEAARRVAFLLTLASNKIGG